ncbi:MAG: preprotein translocase subunit SecG [Clostridia bacterium]|nr:preprotein translocase subunit SecG [Clostridia bacterium]
MEIALGIILIVLAVVLVTCVLLQSGKDKKLSSAITGSADTFFSKGKSKSKDKMLSRITTILSVVFVVLTVVTVLVITALN